MDLLNDEIFVASFRKSEIEKRSVLDVHKHRK